MIPTAFSWRKNTKHLERGACMVYLGKPDSVWDSEKDDSIYVMIETISNQLLASSHPKSTSNNSQKIYTTEK